MTTQVNRAVSIPTTSDPITMPVMTIDFEASCLPRHGKSFPIEVGIADASGATRAWLIRPHPDWDGWDWTEEAQSLHGLTRDRIEREGLPADLVVGQLADAVQGHRVIADSHLDAGWLDTLCRAAAVPPPFGIGHVEEIVAGLGATDGDVQAVVADLDRWPFRRHRAEEDARWLAGLIAGLSARCASPGRPLFVWPATAGAPPLRTAA
jgi:hypothetical protein